MHSINAATSQGCEDFTLNGYRDLLRVALEEGYQFLSFHSAERYSTSKVCLLRHDIDADLGAAFELAKIEVALGVRATYFLMLRSPIYNLFSRADHRFVQQIVDMGHDLAFHFDDNFSIELNQEINRQVKMEAEIIERMFGVNIYTVSIHQPSSLVLKGDVQLSGYLNTYNREDFKGFHYISDSNKIWKDLSPRELFKQGDKPKIQILIHPIWWNKQRRSHSTEEIWDQAIIDNFERAQEQLLETERAYGEKRVLKLKSTR